MKNFRKFKSCWMFYFWANIKLWLKLIYCREPFLPGKLVRGSKSHCQNPSLMRIFKNIPNIFTMLLFHCPHHLMIEIFFSKCNKRHKMNLNVVSCIILCFSILIPQIGRLCSHVTLMQKVPWLTCFQVSACGVTDRSPSDHDRPHLDCPKQFRLSKRHH